VSLAGWWCSAGIDLVESGMERPSIQILFLKIELWIFWAVRVCGVARVLGQ
jgi:hypothetical protein